jgi:hypothetical protein
MTRPHRFFTLAALTSLVAIPGRAGEARAWDPLAAVVDGLGAAGSSLADAGRFVGRVIGAPLGGIVEAATTPTIETTELGAHRLIDDIDARVGKQVGNLDTLVGKSAQRVDTSLQARIVQVSGVLDESIGRVDEVARRRIDQVGKIGKELIDHANVAIQADLERVDQILANRTGQLGQLVSSTLSETDRIVTERIDQVDQVAARQLGTLDVLATKQSLNLEAGLLRVAALVGLIIFAAFGLWRFFMETVRARDEIAAAKTARGSPRVSVIKAVLARAGFQVGAAAVCAGVIGWLGLHLPLGAERNLTELKRQQRAALDGSLARLDFTQVRYHAAQLQILAPEMVEARGIALKADLLRAVFTRPALVKTAEGLKDLMSRVGQIEALVPTNEPDLEVIKAYVLWRAGGTRRSEYEAAAMCARALERSEQDPGTDGALSRTFLLRPLAIHYLRTFLYQPWFPSHPESPELAGYHLARLTDVARRFAKQSDFFAPLQQMIEFDRLVKELDTASTPAYLAMVESQAELGAGAARLDKQASPRTLVEAKKTRREHARAVIAAWRAFDQKLQTNGWLLGSPLVLGVFTLNDAVLSRALYVDSHPDDLELPPRLMGSPAPPPRVRIVMAPLRVAWAKRYQLLVGPNARLALEQEETDRFRLMEQRTADFERATVSFLAARRAGAANTSALGIDAAKGAAVLGLYRKEKGGWVSYADWLLAEGRVKPEAELSALLSAGYQRRTLPLL